MLITDKEREKAIQWHMDLKWYDGYKCEAHNLTEYGCKECNEFIRSYKKNTIEQAIADVEYRISNKLPLTGFNDRPQDQWTY